MSAPIDFTTEERDQATQMAAWLPFSVQMEVFKNPGGLVARTLYENRGDAASFFADIAQEPGGVPEDIKKLAQDYVNTTPNQRDNFLMGVAITTATGTELAEWLAGQRKRGAELARANNEEERALQGSDKQRADYENQMRSMEALSKMGYDEWSSLTYEQRVEKNRQIADAQKANDEKAEDLKQVAKDKYLAANENSEDARAELASIEAGLKLQGDERVAFINKLSPGGLRLFRQLDTLNDLSVNNVSLVMVTAQRTGDYKQSEEEVQRSFADKSIASEDEVAREESFKKMEDNIARTSDLQYARTNAASAEERDAYDQQITDARRNSTDAAQQLSKGASDMSAEERRQYLEMASRDADLRRESFAPKQAVATDDVNLDDDVPMAAKTIEGIDALIESRKPLIGNDNEMSGFETTAAISKTMRQRPSGMGGAGMA